MGMTSWQFLIVVNILLLIAGNFMEPTGIILILAPILFPIAGQLGIDPVHLGIIMVVNLEIGMVTPPVGLNLFVTAAITGMSIMEVVRAALPWLSVLLVFLVIVTYMPRLSLALPDLFFEGGGPCLWWPEYAWKYLRNIPSYFDYFAGIPCGKPAVRIAIRIRGSGECVPTAGRLGEPA